MDLIKTTKDLADILKEKKLSSIGVKLQDFEIFLEDKPQHFVVNNTANGGGIQAVIPPAVTSAVAAPSVQVSGGAGNFVTSPIVGTFYASPSPDKPPFVKVGDKVEKGQVVCIVESMKLMNEINSEFAGTVAEILVKDGQAIEFEQELIRLD
ncbi:MAG: acetyl-CoA carboxylase biotin carboxyl carrier protein [Oscillospiraceae bacterium]|nr:acetyl-CoA carboxylase biotin carboxyl carrier protein [Oscillospiraceae bacterium]